MHTLTYHTKQQYDTIDITEDVKNIVAKEKIWDGICVVYVPHATCAIVINENYDPNIQKDLHNALQALVPEGKWLHDKIDGNGAAHLKAAILGPNETIIIHGGKLQLGTWQDIILIEFDGPKGRERSVCGRNKKILTD